MAAWQHLNLTLYARQAASLAYASTTTDQMSVKLMPDMAFLLDPVQAPEEPEVDVLLLLRTDRERQGGVMHKDVIDLALSVLSTANVTFAVRDWVLSAPLAGERTPSSPTGFALSRWVTAQKVVGSGKIVITDRLHASIVALLVDRPHITVDNIYNKVSGVRRLALQGQLDYVDAVLQAHHAPDVHRALQLALRIMQGGRSGAEAYVDVTQGPTVETAPSGLWLDPLGPRRQRVTGRAGGPSGLPEPGPRRGQRSRSRRSPADPVPPSKSPPRVYIAPRTGRKYMASVVGLASDVDVYGSNVSRLSTFMESWTRAWPGLHIEHQHAFINHRTMMGLGCAAGHYLALAESLRYLRTRNETCDYHLMFEDDALPFAGSAWPATAHAPVNDLDARLDYLDSINGTVLVLGGHTFQNYSKVDAEAASRRQHNGIVHLGHVDGSFVYVFKCKAMDAVAKGLHHLLRQPSHRLWFEKELWKTFSSLPGEGGVHVSIPLLVDHAHGFSATWNETRDRPQEGSAIFW
jgi:hypothetical protein